MVVLIQAVDVMSVVTQVGGGGLFGVLIEFALSSFLIETLLTCVKEVPEPITVNDGFEVIHVTCMLCLVVFLR